MLRATDLLKIKNCEINSSSDSEKLMHRTYSGVSIDSRKIKRGEIFFAIKGEVTDGHKYINEVLRKGISTFVVNKKWFKKNKNVLRKATCFLVNDTIRALGEFANNHRNNFNVQVLCIGGSNGKTTTKDLIADVLSQKYKVHKTEGNFNNHIGLPLTLLKLNKSHELCVLEAGCNHFGEISYLCRIAEPQFGLITNIGKEHLEFLKDLKGVAKAEFELYEYLRSKSGKMFFNLDDKFIRSYAGKINHESKFTYSYKLNPDVRGKFNGYNINFEPEIEIKSGKIKFNTIISTIGKHSIYNGLAAAAVGLYFEVGQRKISGALKNFKNSSPKRMEVIKTGGITIINDTYNSNPESVKMGLETLSDYKIKGNKYAVISDMLELGKSSKKEHSEIGKLAVKLKLKNLYTYGKESKYIFINSKSIKNNFYFNDKESLIKMLKLNIRNNDVIYVKGSRGMKMEDVVKGLTES